MIFRYLMAAAAVTALLFPLHSSSQRGANVETVNGLRIVAFDTIYGTVKVNTPDDLSAGDTISGTVILEPKGSDDKTVATNLDQLKKFEVRPEKEKPFLMTIEDVFKIEGRGTVVTGRVFKWTAPEGKSTENLILIDPNGNEAGRQTFPILRRATMPPITVSTVRTFHLPVIAQAGRPAQAHGIFDGDFGSTKLLFGGQEALLLAESPRQLIFESPASVIGPSNIELHERDVVIRETCNNLKLSLSAVKTVLATNEQTTANLEVRGLERLRQATPVRMEKLSGGVSVEGGDVQTITIKPEDVQVGGIFRTSRVITANSPGDFVLKATIVLPPPPRWPPLEPTASVSPTYLPPPNQPTQPTQPTQPSEPERHFTKEPKCPCIPPEDKIVIDRSKRVIVEVGWIYGPRYDNADDARKACEAKLPDAVTRCRADIIAEIADKVRAACATSQKIDESCAPGVKCKPTDTAGLPNPDGITTDAKCTAELRDAPGPRPRKKIYIGTARGTCSFKGTIYVLCDP